MASLGDMARRAWQGIMQLAQIPVFGTGGLVDTTPAELRQVLAISESERERQEDIIQARRFHDGLHQVHLTERLEEFLGDDSTRFAVRLNFIQKVNRAPAARLIVEGFDTTAEGDEQSKQLEFANMVWAGSRMKAKKWNILDTIKDGESYILVDFDAENQRARLTPHKRYTDTKVTIDGETGDGEGIRLYYPNDDADMKPMYGCKRWFEQLVDERGVTKLEARITLYFPGVVAKFRQQGASWVKLIDKDESGELPWPIPWVHPTTGEDLGIPIVHLKSPDLMPRAMEAIPIQKALNKTFIDSLASSDMEAFRLIFTFGWEAKDKDGTAFDVAPGTFLGSMNKDARVQELAASDPSNYIAIIDRLIAHMADATDTPLTLLQRSNQRAAEGTLQEEKEAFIALVRDYADGIELAYEDSLKIARRLQNAFGDGGLDEEPEFRVRWQPFYTRAFEERIREVEALQLMGVPQPDIWRAWGEFSEDQIETMQLAAFGDGFPALKEGEE